MGERPTGHAREIRADVWELTANLPRRLDERRGRRVTKRISAKGKRRAEAALQRWLDELEQHACTDPERITVGEILDRWLEQSVAQSVRPKTRERYQEIVRLYLRPNLGRSRVAELRPADLSAFYARMQQDGRADGRGGLSAQTALHLHRVLRTALTWALDEELIARNPAARVKSPPKPARPERAVWTSAQIAIAIREAERSQVRVPAALAGYAGLRRGEVCALTWSDVDLERRVLIVRGSVEQTKDGLHFGDPKTARSARVLPIPRQLAEILEARKAAHDEMRLAGGRRWNPRELVCCRVDGRPINPDSLTSAWRQFVRQHGLEPAIEFHGLRRSYGAGLHARGEPARLLMERLGHQDAKTSLAFYTRVFDETSLAAVERQEQEIAAALEALDSAKVCRARAGRVVSLEDRRQRRE